MKRSKVRVLLYKPTDLVGDAICWWTDSDYCHVEMVVDNLHISADSNNGVRVRQYKGQSADKVVELEYDVTLPMHSKLIDYTTALNGAKYDKLAIVFSQVIRLGADRKDRWYCSELVTKILQLLGEDKLWHREPHMVNPGDIAQILTGSRYLT